MRFNSERCLRNSIGNCKKKAEEGKKIIGKKVGLTSVAMQKMLGC